VNDLAEFLLARIAEDSSLAHLADEDAQRLRPITDDLAVPTDGDRRVAHMFRWSPARVLAECEAKRRIVEDYLAQVNSHRSGWDARTPRDHPLRALALPYADHPDYRPEWRP
jgi:Family of unknown function (DUF6221)